MRKIEEIRKLRMLLKKPVFCASEVREAGVHPSVVNYYIKKGLIERIGRGTYKGKSNELVVDFQWEDLVLGVKSVPNGVVCLVSALALYELTEDIPRKHWIAIPHATTEPKRKGVKFIRMRNMVLGQTEMKVGKEKIQIFDRERTIVDAFRYLGRETAIKALKNGLKARGDKKINLKKLREYSKKLRVKLDSYLLVITT